MTRIITPEINKKLKREYKLRFFSVLFFVLAGVVVIHILLALSSYLMLNSYEGIYQKSIQETNGEIIKQHEEFVTRTANLFELSKKVAPIQVSPAVAIFEKIQQYSLDKISIHVFEFYTEEDKQYVTIRGVAETREALLEFDDKMKSDTSFEGFSIPLDVLTKQREIAFDITFTYHEN